MKTNMREETLRASLHQFMGGVLASYDDPEQSIGIIMEELTKVISKDSNLKEFNNNTIKPILKSALFIMSQKHDKLYEDSNKAFNGKIPPPVQMKLKNDRQIIDLLDNYIKQL